MHAFAVAAALFFVLPFVFVVLTALMTDQQSLTRDLWPDPFEWHNLVDVWHTPGFVTWWRNTLMYAVAGTAPDPGLEHPGGVRAGPLPVPGPAAGDDDGDRDDDAAAAGRDHPDVPGLGQAAAPLRHAVAADHPDGLRRRVLDLPAAPVPGDHPAGVPRRRQGRRLRRAPGAAAGRAADGPAGDRRGGAVPVLLLLERLLRAADLRQREPGRLDAQLRAGVVQERPPHELEPDHGRHPAGDGAGDRRCSSSPRRPSSRASR